MGIPPKNPAFALFLLAIALCVLLFTDSDYPLGIFKFYLLPYGDLHIDAVICVDNFWSSCCLFSLGIFIYMLNYIYISNTHIKHITKLIKLLAFYFLVLSYYVSLSSVLCFPLCYLCLFAQSGVQHILYCVFVLFFFVLCTLCCQFLWNVYFWLTLRYSLTCIYSFSGLSIFDCAFGIL